MGPIWVRQDPGGPQVGQMNLVIWDGLRCRYDDSYNAWKIVRRFVQCTEIKKNVIHTSHNNNDDNADVSQSWIFLDYLNYRTQLFRKLFLTK